MKNKKANCEKYERNVGRKGHGWRIGKLALILFGLVWGDSIGNTPLERERERERDMVIPSQRTSSQRKATLGFVYMQKKWRGGKI